MVYSFYCILKEIGHNISRFRGIYVIKGVVNLACVR